MSNLRANIGDLVKFKYTERFIDGITVCEQYSTFEGKFEDARDVISMFVVDNTHHKYIVCLVTDKFGQLHNASIHHEILQHAAR